MTNKFEIGQTYSTSSVCDSNCVFSITVVRRTAKTIWTECGKQLRVDLYEDSETVMPMGRYSMAPCISAKRYKDKPVERAVPNPSFASLVEEGRSLFTEEQFGQILTTLADTLAPVAVEVPKTTAKVYNFADYLR